MNILLFGATGMIGQGALRECLLDPAVRRVVAVGRRPAGERHEKFRDLVVPDPGDLSAVERTLRGFDACFFCLGTSAAGKSEREYTAQTYDLTIAAATTLARLNPGMTFIYVSGLGTDSTEHGKVTWARVKGRTENALLRLGFKGAYMFRPGVIRPLHGIKSRTTAYRLFYAIAGPLLPIVKAVFPNSITTTAQVGRAMLAVAKNGYPTPILEMRDINSV